MGENGIENVFHEIMGEKSSNQEKERSTKDPKQNEPKRSTPRHIIITMSKVKEIILKKKKS